MIHWFHQSLTLAHGSTGYRIHTNTWRPTEGSSQKWIRWGTWNKKSSRQVGLSCHMHYQPAIRVTARSCRPLPSSFFFLRPERGLAIWQHGALCKSASSIGHTIQVLALFIPKVPRGFHREQHATRNKKKHARNFDSPVFSLISQRTLNKAGFIRWQFKVCFLKGKREGSK